MSTRLHILFLGVSIGLAAVCGILPAGAQSQTAADPASLPAHDAHQGVTIAVRPLITEAAYKAQFMGHTPYEAGLLALEVFFRNDNDKPIRLTLTTMQLSVERSGETRQTIHSLTAEEVADRVLLKTPGNVRAPRLPIPIGGPKAGNRDKNWREFAARMRAAGIPSDIVGPKSTVRGFLYFDIDHQYNRLSDARLDVPDIAFMLNNEALFYFQVDLAPAVR